MASSFTKGPIAAACLLALTAGLAQAAAPKTRSYIVQLSDAPAASYRGGVSGLPATQVPEGERLQAAAPHVRAYLAHLDQRQRAVLAQLPGAVKVLHHYRFSYNGFAAQLTPAQARALARTPGVVRVTLDVPRALNTNHTPQFLGLDQPGGVWSLQRKGQAVKGEDVVIGLVDTGIQPENASFYDRVDSEGRPVMSGGSVAYGAAPAGWTGACEAGPGFDPATHCNHKLIGARSFDASFRATGATPAWFEFSSSPRDADGHGSHTASIAGGNWGAAAPVNGQDVGPLSGVAPRARIAAYKACWTYVSGDSFATNCWTGDTMAAIDQAVADGVDVINFSIGGSATDLLDPVEVAFFNATAAGVFVAASAGNDGPGTAVEHNSPWVTTVAASTHDRFMMADALFGNGDTYRGASQSKGLPMTGMVLAAEARAPGQKKESARLCFLGSLDPDKVAGKVVVCDRGFTARTEKSQEVHQAGGVGMVLLNTPPDVPGGGSTTLNDDPHWVPSVHLPASDRDAVRAYATRHRATAALGVASQEPGVVAPVMASFSSRGPNLATPSVMKPDLTAPGVAVVAAYAATQPDQAFHDGIVAGTVVPPATAFYLDGTSMASPHVAGTAALIKQKHPRYWGPASIRSSLQTSAGAVKLATGAPDPDYRGYGAGHLNPNGALDAGLLYQIEPVDYIRYLCGEGWLGASTATCLGVGSIEPSDLNLPSLSGNVPGALTFHRTVRNLGNSTVTYNATASVDGFSATVTPSSLTLEKGQKGRFSVTLAANGAAVGAWKQGALTWSDGVHQVRSPIQARLVELAGPAELRSQEATDKVAATYRFGFSGAVSTQTGGLLPAARQENVVARASVRDGDAACRANAEGTTKLSLVAPAGTMALRAATYDAETRDGSGQDDLDLYLYDAGGTLLAISGGATSEEMVQLITPAAGTYTVCVHGYAPADGVNTPFYLSSWVLGPGAGSPALTVGGLPSSVATGDAVKVRFRWSGATVGARYLGGLRMVKGADVNTGPTLGVTLVSVEPGVPQGTRGLSSARKTAERQKR